jgi:hypothetical protein
VCFTFQRERITPYGPVCVSLSCFSYELGNPHDPRSFSQQCDSVATMCFNNSICSHCFNSDLGNHWSLQCHCCICCALVAVLMSTPLTWREEHLWNFSALQSNLQLFQFQLRNKNHYVSTRLRNSGSMFALTIKKSFLYFTTPL